jgi:hypothetical protein
MTAYPVIAGPGLPNTAVHGKLIFAGHLPRFPPNIVLRQMPAAERRLSLTAVAVEQYETLYPIIYLSMPVMRRSRH